MEMLGLGMQKEKIGFRMKLSWNDTNFHSTYVCHTIKNRFECNNSKSCALNDFLLFSIQIHKSRIFVYVNHCHFTHTLSIWFFWFLCNFNRCPMQTAKHIKGLYSGFFNFLLATNRMERPSYGPYNNKKTWIMSNKISPILSAYAKLHGRFNAIFINSSA